ncbi:unnamed protein product [Clonostachys rosea]|uniref:Uncharacterized protein n=1 Tax=Bionectria ochroleuca TaxID=29856 RepID=A0ABY6UL08_BIOOC|nr:unnamed protein product [Clonostachys rosea]
MSRCRNAQMQPGSRLERPDDGYVERESLKHAQKQRGGSMDQDIDKQRILREKQPGSCPERPNDKYAESIEVADLEATLNSMNDNIDRIMGAGLEAAWQISARSAEYFCTTQRACLEAV